MRTRILWSAIGIALLSVAVARGEGAYLRDSGDLLLLGNDRVELKIDRSTGFFADILNKSAGTHHKLPNTGSWPFGLRLGNSYAPDLLRAEITGNPLHPQKMSHSVSGDSNSRQLTCEYADLITTGGSRTGISLRVTVTLDGDADYFRIRAHLENHGQYSITNLFSGSGDLVADQAHEKEALAVPGWSYGTIWSNPYESFSERETFGYPIFGSNACLDAGWIDLYGPTGGIGIAYLNRQGLSMHFNVQRSGKGMNLNWQLFDLMHEKARTRWTAVGGIYPLKPGQNFDTDTWLLAAHAGDWHRMADIYRSEYEKVFQGDFLNWESTHPLAKNLDFIKTETVLNIRDQLKGEPSLVQFEAIPERIGRAIEVSGVKPENTILALMGHSIHWCLYMPDFLPLCPEGGGEAGFKKMVTDLRSRGINNFLFYTHLFYNHPKANDYVPEAETGYDHQNVLWKEIGNVACMTTPAWVDLWKKKYIPGYRDLGAAGIFIDQGPTQYIVCPNPAHPHGDDSVAMLGNSVKGVDGLIEAFRTNFGGKRPLFWSEAGSDIQARKTDIWSCAHKSAYASGGESRHEIVRYTFPYRVCVDDSPANARDVNNILVNGFVLGGWMTEFDPSAKELAPTIQQYSRIRRELRDSKAPGYPYGFRDTNGLRVSDSNLVARSYVSEAGVTVVYYAAEPVTDARVQIDKAVLGFEGPSTEEFVVTLEKNQAGYKVVPRTRALFER